MSMGQADREVEFNVRFGVNDEGKPWIVVTINGAGITWGPEGIEKYGDCKLTDLLTDDTLEEMELER